MWNLSFLNLYFLSFYYHTGWGGEIFRLSSDPVRAFEGSNAVFQWILEKQLTSRPDFQRVVFGVWKNGYVASYILSVTKNGGIFTNPSLKEEAPSLAGRVQWKGDLFKSIAAFQISHISALDQKDYGMRLEFDEMKDSESDFISLRVEGKLKAHFTGILQCVGQHSNKWEVGGGRQRGRVVRALDFKSGGPGFKSRSDR